MCGCLPSHRVQQRLLFLSDQTGTPRAQCQQHTPHYLLTTSSLPQDTPHKHRLQQYTPHMHCSQSTPYAAHAHCEHRLHH
eukprot:1160383-Pelagomonas_calceolata.AAC.3